MQEIKMTNIKKYYGNKLVLDIEDLAIEKGDKIGIVGPNGAGKTSLLELIDGRIYYDSGQIHYGKNTKIKYLDQLAGPGKKRISGKSSSIFKVPRDWTETMSGGEKTRFKLAEVLQSKDQLLLLDEPTNNLDLEAIDLLTDQLKDYQGSILLVSHNRDLLDQLSNKILEIEGGRPKIYKGNYSNYLDLKEMENQRKDFEYRQFIKEKNRLDQLKRNLERKSAKVKTTPKRMGNSEARLHKMGGQKNKIKLDRAAKSIDKRIEQLDRKEKFQEEEKIRIEIPESSQIHSKILISAKDLSLGYGEEWIFKKASFSIKNGSKTGLIGPNGSGKTSLIRLILRGQEVGVNEKLKIGYFDQSLDNLDPEKTILENLMEGSVHGEERARLVLARLLIRGDKLDEKLEILSGGERVKVSLAKIILGDSNFLLLDEPTNHLDTTSLEVLEDLLAGYNGSILLVSHDRRFIENTCQDLLIIEDKKIRSFSGSYRDYQDKKSKKPENQGDKLREDRIILVKNQLTALISQISIEENKDKKAEYDRKYRLKLEELKSLEKN